MVDEGRCLRRGSLLALRAYASRTEEGDGREQTPSPDPRFPPMAYIPVGPPSRYTLFGSPHTASENRPRLRPIWGSCAPLAHH